MLRPAHNPRAWARLRKRLPLALAAVFTVLSFAAVFSLMDHVQNLLSSDVRINLAEIATQNEEIIAGRLSMQVNNLNLAAEQIADRLPPTDDITDAQLRSAFSAYIRQKPHDRAYVASRDGKAFFADGRELDIAGRKYFRLASAGKRNISDRIISRLTGDDVFVISVPLLHNGKIIGTVQQSYSQEEMFTLCKLSLFSSQGQMFIINSQGYILISSQHSTYGRESDNYFRILHASNPEQRRQMEQDIKNNTPGFIETTLQGNKIFSAYTPVEHAYDWYLISSIDKNAVSPNAGTVTTMFYVILCMVVAIFFLLICLILYNKHRQETQIKTIAFVDMVTKGCTYNKFVVHYQDMLLYAPEVQLSFVAFDVDNFTFINNAYGFAFGDTVLRAIDERISRHLHRHELLARVHSDHFILLLEDARQERLEALFDEIHEIDGVRINIHAGCYTISDRGEELNRIMDKANIAAKSVKNIRYERIGVYSKLFEQRILHKEHFHRTIEQALANHEFLPFFQPKVNINNRRITGAEALHRWQTRDGRTIFPEEFVPFCEDSGLIVDIDMGILEHTLGFLQDCLRNNTPCVPISVNFSVKHLQKGDFVQQLVDKMEKFQVPPRLLEVELAESVMFEDQKMLESFIGQLHEAHMTLSLDNFGSGYFSLNMLQDIPIDSLKINRSFLRRTVHRERQKFIFSAVSQMARNLGISIVVEGIETIGNIDLMREAGCTIAQGYYYAKPLKREDFVKIYRAGVV